MSVNRWTENDSLHIIGLFYLSVDIKVMQPSAQNIGKLKIGVKIKMLHSELYDDKIKNVKVGGSQV